MVTFAKSVEYYQAPVSTIWSKDQLFSYPVNDFDGEFSNCSYVGLLKWNRVNSKKKGFLLKLFRFSNSFLDLRYLKFDLEDSLLILILRIPGRDLIFLSFEMFKRAKRNQILANIYAVSIPMWVRCDYVLTDI